MSEADRLRRAIDALHDIARLLESSDDATERIGRALALLRTEIVACDRCAFLEAPAAERDELIVTPTPAARERARLRQKLASLFRLITEDEEPAVAEGGPEPTEASEYCHLALPVIGVDRTIGVLFIERRADEPFGEESLRLLSLVAAQLGGYVAALTRRR